MSLVCFPLGAAEAAAPAGTCRAWFTVPPVSSRRAHILGASCVSPDADGSESVHELRSSRFRLGLRVFDLVLTRFRLQEELFSPAPNGVFFFDQK